MWGGIPLAGLVGSNIFSHPTSECLGLKTTPLLWPRFFQCNSMSHHKMYFYEYKSTTWPRKNNKYCRMLRKCCWRKRKKVQQITSVLPGDISTGLHWVIAHTVFLQTCILSRTHCCKRSVSVGTIVPPQAAVTWSQCMSQHPQPQPGQRCLLSEVLLLILPRPDRHWQYHKPSCKRKNEWPGRLWHQELALLGFVCTAMNSLLGISKGDNKKFQSTFCLQCCDRTQGKYIKSCKTNLLPYIIQ